MKNLETTYMGLTLKNPIVAGSSGLTSNLKQIKQLEEAGIGAVVLKSLFEEQINSEATNVLQTSEHNQAYPEAEDYILNYTKNNSINQYLQLIKDASSEVNIPVIASINCMTNTDWVMFAKEVEKAGADAIELNIFEMAADRNKPSEFYEKLYIDIIKSVSKVITIPVAVKIGPHFTNMVRIIDQLNANGAKAITLFNRFYQPDIDLDKLEFINSGVYSSPDDLARVLRWTGIVKGQLPKVEISASTGIHDANGAIKQLLAGAQVVQLCSTLYLNGFGKVNEVKFGIEAFMEKNNFDRIDDFRARLSYAAIKSPEVYERAQFMRYFSNKK